MAQLICEHSECTSEHAFEESHSSIAVLQCVKPDGYSFFQCEQGQDHNFLNWQHYHCSHDHMKEGFSSCITDHYKEEDLHPIPIGGGTTIIHKVVLGSNLQCKVCQQPLIAIAYRFCLTVCTPMNNVPDESLDQIGGWCCSLDHARQSALDAIAQLREGAC